jgi:hypothetical protein
VGASAVQQEQHPCAPAQLALLEFLIVKRKIPSINRHELLRAFVPVA